VKFALNEIKRVSLAKAPLNELAGFLSVFENQNMLSVSRLDSAFRACKFKERKNSKAWKALEFKFISSVVSVIRFCVERLEQGKKEVKQVWKEFSLVSDKEIEKFINV